MLRGTSNSSKKYCYWPIAPRNTNNTMAWPRKATKVSPNKGRTPVSPHTQAHVLWVQHQTAQYYTKKQTAPMNTDDFPNPVLVPCFHLSCQIKWTALTKQVTSKWVSHITIRKYISTQHLARTVYLHCFSRKSQDWETVYSGQAISRTHQDLTCSTITIEKNTPQHT